MRTKDELYRESLRRIAARRQRAVMQAEEARREAFAAHPALAEAENARVRAGLQMTRLAMTGGDPAAAQNELRRADAAVAEALRGAGLTGTAFEPAYHCPLCQDTGSRDGIPCACVAEMSRRLRREEINAASPLGLCQFTTFDLTRYPDTPDPELGRSVRTYMTKVYNFCRRYAENFTPQSNNLFLMGTAGLGKTHLALAVADTVLDKGYDVLYTSAAALAARLGREHFDRDSGGEWLSACQEADLLILDDLGTEYITPLTISVLYELINARMLRGRPTVYTTNITDQSVFVARYTEKVASRILGRCDIFKFFGTDQRIRKA